MAQTERQFDELLDGLVSELAMEEVGEPDEPIVRAPAPTPPPAQIPEPAVPRPPARTWLAVAGIFGAAGATLGVAAFVIFGGTHAEAAGSRTQARPAEAAPVEETASAPPAQVVPVVVPQPAAPVPTIAEPPEGQQIPEVASDDTATKKPKSKRKKRRKRPRKKTRKAPPSGDRFEDL